MKAFKKERVLKNVSFMALVIAAYIFWVGVIQPPGILPAVRIKPLAGRKLDMHKTTPSVSYRKDWGGFADLAEINCTLAFSNQSSNSMFIQRVNRTRDETIINHARDCTAFRKNYGFDRYPPVADEEREFPLAFITLFHSDLDQVLLLLRAIYRPHNTYCLSVDKRSGIKLLNATQAVAKCLPNVFLASRMERVVYAGFTRLQADVNCMEDLVKSSVTWRYVINMPGQQFPLKTNLEMVKILKKFNGSNDIEGITGTRMLPERFKNKWIYRFDNKTGQTIIEQTPEKLGPPPHNFQVVKGSAYGTFSRSFVEYVIKDRRAKDLLHWMRDVKSPDEYFWATLHHSRTQPVPGSYTAGQPDKKPWLTVFASWGGQDPCATIRKRGVCIFSTEDLPQLWARHEFFANKFYITHHPAALHCLDQRLYNMTLAGSVRDLHFYDTLPFVRSRRKHTVVQFEP